MKKQEGIEYTLTFSSGKAALDFNRPLPGPSVVIRSCPIDTFEHQILDDKPRTRPLIKSALHRQQQWLRQLNKLQEAK